MAMNTDGLIVLGVSTIVALNIYATFRVIRSGSFETNQKLTQTLPIWILPVLGAMLMLYFSDKGDDGFGPGSSYGGGHDSTPAGGYDNDGV